MPDVEIYSTHICPYCYRAKRLLDDKGVKYTEINVMLHPGRRQEMVRRAHGGTTVPQIFINGEHVGGCDDLYSLEAAGELDAMLEGRE
jgi:glutaredoxin 3